MCVRWPLLQACPAVEGYIRSNGAKTVKVLKGKGYYELKQT